MRMSKKFNEGLPPKLYRCESCGKTFPKTDMADIRIVEFQDEKQALTNAPKEHQVFRVRICKDCVDKAEWVIVDWLDS